MVVLGELHVNNYITQLQEEEMKRIANELHEGPGQQLFSVATGLEFLQSGIQEPGMREYAKELNQLLRRTIEEIRFISAELYPITLEKLGLDAALKSFFTLYTSTFGVVVHVKRLGEEIELTENISLAIFRCCQEALLNIAAHAEVDEANFYFTWEKKSLKIDVIDKGKGFDKEAATANRRLKGVAAMEQRMHQVGGEFSITSELEKGTTVTLLLPIQEGGIER
ncbi:sensor histidine kinase [Virgibacillus halodenitrificans]|uniref:sensor histidine kinase n=1 Tax=Virgibacillus halodenitrificans TaxID=1482 RepID=UPI00045D5058|nr:histidine kinase [Virgibacillus halodenitrificans]MEC2159235.1 histidine kinase [Virgibacillus halodenitrificans]CDQ37113.1 Oxygen sensor histidine kinase NreB [Virgibacillus halodenitrificans]